MNMDTIIRLGFCIVLLLITLGMAMSFLAGPIGILKKTGALKAGRWAGRSAWRGTIGLFRFVLKRRRPRIRRFSSRAPTGNLR
jgi:hypothetical protein